ncbi:hypothetical protein AYJ08_18135 [Brevibacillus sp. SKDU10]|nr:hypothetical protein AYJ08_18135 [Brevibacillus sp. SKDU10]
MLTKKKWIQALSGMLLLTCLTPYPNVKGIDTHQGLQETYSEQRTTQYNLQKKQIMLSNQDRYWIERIQSRPGVKHIKQKISLFIPGTRGEFRYLTSNGAITKWTKASLQGNLPVHTGYIKTDQYSIILSKPHIYIPRTHNSIEIVPKNINQIKMIAKKTYGGFNVSIEMPVESHMFGEVWALESFQPLIDWDALNMELIWKSIDFEDRLRWSWDGFYDRTPTTYVPTGPNYFWRNPDNYFATSFVITRGSRAAHDLGWIMLHTILPNQNAQGFWPSAPKSTWLWNDYQVDAGFYDTRFNTDIAYLLLKAYQSYHDERFLQASMRYAEFFLQHSQQNHFLIERNGQVGILVSDYSHEKPHKLTHSSLNHQLQEMNYLYELYMQTKDERFKELADKMLWGIKLTRDAWVMPNSNLHYAYMPDGTMGLKDYPFLTYNDLHVVQSVLMLIQGWEDPDLAYLMQMKKQWMDANNVTGYRK